MTSTLEQPWSAVNLEPFMGFITKELLIRYRLRRDGVDKNHVSFFATILYVGKSSPEPFEILLVKFYASASEKVSYGAQNFNIHSYFGGEERLKSCLRDMLEPWNNSAFQKNNALLAPKAFVGMRTTADTHAEVLEPGHEEFRFFTGVLFGELSSHLNVIKHTDELRRTYGRPLEKTYERMLVRFGTFAAQQYTFAK